VRTTAGVATVVALAVGLAACGDDEERAADEPKRLEVRCTPAPGSPQELTFEPKFKPGDRRTVIVEKTRQTAAIPKGTTATSEAELSVVSGGPKKGVLRWQTAGLNLPIVEGADPDLIKRYEEEAERVRYDYSTTADGAVGDLENPEEVRAGYNRALDIFADLDPKAEHAANRVRPLLQSESALRAGLSEPLVLHGLYGLELEPGKPFETPYELPNPLGGGPIEATATFELETVRDPDGCAVVNLAVEADPAALKEFLSEFFERAGGQAPGEPQLAGIKMSTDATYRYDPGSGWVAHVRARREQSIAGQTRNETTVVTTAPG
jgi:hypothetical protein